MKIKVGFFAILLFFSLFITHPSFSFASLLAVFLHELGHLLAARICHIGMKEFSLGLFGAGLTPDDRLYSYFDEIILCLGGPLTNLFFASLALFSSSSPFLESFIFASFAYGILNLLPIRTFDGGRIFRSLLLFFLPLTLTEKILSALSFFCIFCLWSISVYLLLRTTSSLSLFVFSLSLFCRLFLPEE